VDGSCWAIDLRLSLVKGAALEQGDSVSVDAAWGGRDQVMGGKLPLAFRPYSQARAPGWALPKPSSPAWATPPPPPGHNRTAWATPPPRLATTGRPGPLPPPAWPQPGPQLLCFQSFRVFLCIESRPASNIRLTSLRQPCPLLASLLWLRFLGTTGAFEHRHTYF
jgi:hypothetical protein